MILSAVVAIDNKNAIGKDGGIPWYLPADLKHFKDVTMGHSMIMGRKTHQSIGKALPGRQSIVISHDQNYQAEGCLVVASLEDAIAKAEPKDEVCVIGGQAIFDLAMPRINRIYLTKIDTNTAGDKFFEYDPSQWQVVKSQKFQKDDANKYDYEFLTLERRA